MDAGEVAITPSHLRQSALQLQLNLVGLILQPLGSVLRKFHHRRVGAIPIARTILVEIRRRAGKTTEGVAVDGRGFTREDAG